jgi:hypothetical protein
MNNYKSTASVLLEEQLKLTLDYVYYDYMSDEIVFSYISWSDWPTHPGDHNLVYLGEL